MLRSAAKNHERVAVVVDPDDYAVVVGELRAGGGDLSPAPAARARAQGVRAHRGVRRRDRRLPVVDRRRRRAHARRGAVAPRAPRHAVACSGAGSTSCATARTRTRRAAFYADARSPLAGWPAARPTIAGAEVLGGKELSYNNILDLDAALGLVPRVRRAAPRSSSSTTTRAASRSAATVAAAYRRARDADPASAFGGIVAVNREVDDGAGARCWSRPSSSASSRPGYSAAARDILGGKKNLRLVAADRRLDAAPTGELAWSRAHDRRRRARADASITGMVDVADAQGRDHARADRAPSARTSPSRGAVAKHVKSNAIVFAQRRRHRRRSAPAR